VTSHGTISLCPNKYRVDTAGVYVMYACTNIHVCTRASVHTCIRVCVRARACVCECVFVASHGTISLCPNKYVVDTAGMCVRYI